MSNDRYHQFPDRSIGHQSTVRRIREMNIYRLNRRKGVRYSTYNQRLSTERGREPVNKLFVVGFGTKAFLFGCIFCDVLRNGDDVRMGPEGVRYVVERYIPQLKKCPEEQWNTSSDVFDRLPFFIIEYRYPVAVMCPPVLDFRLTVTDMN